MKNALEHCESLKRELDNWRSNFEIKLNAVGYFVENNLDDTIDELAEGISEQERLEGELEAAQDLISELQTEIEDLKEEIKRLERELDAAV